MLFYKTFITSVFSVVFSGAQNPSTEYKFEYEYEKSFIPRGPEATWFELQITLLLILIFVSELCSCAVSDLT